MQSTLWGGVGGGDTQLLFLIERGCTLHVCALCMLAWFVSMPWIPEVAIRIWLLRRLHTPSIDFRFTLPHKPAQSDCRVECAQTWSCLPIFVNLWDGKYRRHRAKQPSCDLIWKKTNRQTVKTILTATVTVATAAATTKSTTPTKALPPSSALLHHHHRQW